MDKILEIIEKDQKKKDNEDRYAGRFYYNYKPQKATTKEFYSNDKVIKEKKKGEIYINYFKMLVKQKIDYTLGKKPTYDKLIDDNNTILLWGLFKKMLLNASLDKIAWCNLYIKNNKLKFIVVQDNEIIPYYSEDGKELKELIRYYKKDEKLYIEIWSKTGVRYMIYNKEKIMIDDKTINHYTIEDNYGQSTEEIHSGVYDFIPWVRLDNNDDGAGDIDDIENLIYSYNSITTGFIENVEKFQEAVAILKGYIGEDNELKKIMKKMLEIKAVSVADDGDFGYAKVDIPVEARELLLKILREVIFLVGRGVDPSKLAEGTNITNIVLKSRYIQLDFKGSDTIQKMIEFYNDFLEMAEKMINKSYNPEITFQKSMLINESELIGDILKSMGLVSDERLREIHPFVDDIEKERGRMEKQRKEEVKNNSF
jgi:SPP1 family phage portal protein